MSTSAKYSVLEKLNGNQKELMKKLKETALSWDLQEEEKKFITDITLYRYLSGYLWKFETAEKYLKKTLKWRATYKPQNVRLKDVEPLAKQGYLYHYGHDKQGNPVLYVVLKRVKTEKAEELLDILFKHYVCMNEQCVRNMPDGVYNLTYVVDLKDNPLTISLISSIKGIFDELGEYYADRMARILLINYSWGMSILWSCVKPFLEERVVQKYIFVGGSSEDQIRKNLSDYIDPENLSPDFYGFAKYSFDFENELKREELEIKKFPCWLHK